MARRGGRRNLRLRGRDYSADGAYFVTIVTVNNADLFGDVVRGEVRLNPVGEIVAANWLWLASRYSHVTVDTWSLMPNHLHGILILTTTVAPSATPGAERPAKPLGRLVGAFKTRSTNQVNRARQTPGAVIWQRDFWERVVRDEVELARTREYIRRNPGVYRPRTFAVSPSTYQITRTPAAARISPSREISGSSRSRAAAQISASNGSRLTRISSPISTCSAVRSYGW